MPSSLFPNTIVSQPQPMAPSPQLLNTMANPMQMPQTQEANNQQQILQLWNIVKNSSNPQQILTEAMNQNPQFKKAMDTINSLGDPKAAFYAMAQQKGKDPNSILGLLK